MFFEYRGRKMYYEQKGQGSPVLLLHGWGCDHSIFDSLLPVLEKDYTLYIPDFPGFGSSDEPDSVWGVEEYTSLIESFCKEKGISCPAIVSHSFGGRVSILFASRNPVSKLFLMDAAGIKPHRSIGYYAKVYSYKLMKFFYLKVLRNQEAFERRRAGSGSSDYRNSSPVMKAVLSKVVNEDLCAYMPSIKAPALLFWGEADTATPLSDARKMNSLIKDSGLVTVPGGSHFSFLDDPYLARRVLASFFNVEI